MNKLIVILFIILSFSSTAIGQDILFEFEHSLRIPYHDVSIRIVEKGNEVAMSVRSSPIQNDEKWKYSKKNYSLNVPKEKFKELYKDILNFHRSFIPSKIDYSLTDGTTWTLGFGSNLDEIRFVTNSPEHDTERRNLKEYVRICESIVKLSGLPIKEVLYD